MKSVFAHHWFLACLGLVLATGLLLPHQLGWLAEAGTLRNFIVASVLFMTALVLDSSAIWDAIRRPWPTALAILVNSALVPLGAWCLSLLLTGDLALGVIVTAAAPCTLASAAVWTRRAGGNDAVAIMVTFVTNATCFLVTPFWLAVAADRVGVRIDAADLIVKLGFLVVLPMVLAQALRCHRGIAAWATATTKQLAVVSQIGILAIVLVGAVKCGQQWHKSDIDASLGDVFLVVVLMAGLHTAALFVGLRLGRASGLDRPDWIATGLAGSQKTLMVGLHVALTVGGGLTILPMVTYHVAQLLIDTVWVDRLKAGGDKC